MSCLCFINHGITSYTMGLDALDTLRTGCARSAVGPVAPWDPDYLDT